MPTTREWLEILCEAVGASIMATAIGAMALVAMVAIHG